MNPGGSKIPPEEKLLKLIRGKPQAAMPAGAVAASGSVAAIGSARARGGPPGWLVPMLNILLVGVAVAEVAALVWLTVAPVPEPAVDVAASAGSADEVLAEPEPMPLVSSAMSRPLFAVPDRRASDPVSTTPAGPTDAEVHTMTAQLTLIGVVSGDSPQAIIEDAQTQKTSFVSVGQMVRGFLVEEVHEDRVVLSLNGKKTELSL